MSRGVRAPELGGVAGGPAAGASGPRARRALRLGLAVMAACVLIAGVAPRPARALEPISVTLEVRLPIGADDVPSTLRRRAEKQALEDAVVQVASRYVQPSRLEAEGTTALRDALSPRVASYILTYRLDGEPVRRASELDPLVDEYVVSITVTVDAEQLRQALTELGLTATSERPSVALACELAGEDGVEARFALTPLRQFLSEQLDVAGFAIVEPALFAQSVTSPSDPAALARAAGADVGVAVQVRLRVLDPRFRASDPGGAQGAVAEVQATSVRATDGAQVASVRVEAPGYGADLRAAFVRAIETLQPRLAEDLLAQLETSRASLGAGGSSVRVRLVDVRSLVQVELVQQTLLTVLGAKNVRLAALAPGTAELVVDASLSAMDLRDRLAGAAFPSFALEPVELAGDQLALRVADPLPEPTPAPGDGPPPTPGPLAN